MGFDVVVVGGGTAGCVLAARLSENPDRRVCLLEARPEGIALARALAATEPLSSLLSFVPEQLGDYTRAVPEALYFTDSDEANELIARNPLALLIGFALDQQITVQAAFSGPLKIEQRLGTLDPGAIAATDPARLDDIFRERPAVHRFPRNMARRVQDLCAFVDERYDGHAERLWTEASDSGDLRRRIGELPGFGEMKVKALGSVLAKRFGVSVAEGLVPNHPTLGDVDSPEALAEYQAQKRAHKAERRQAAAESA